MNCLFCQNKLIMRENIYWNAECEVCDQTHFKIKNGTLNSSMFQYGYSPYYLIWLDYKNIKSTIYYSKTILDKPKILLKYDTIINLTPQNIEEKLKLYLTFL